VRVLSVGGIINPISARYLVRGIEEAADEGDAAVLIELDTPGGLLDATQEMTGAMLNARVPVIVYVTPAGTHAASAGLQCPRQTHLRRGVSGLGRIAIASRRTRFEDSSQFARLASRIPLHTWHTRAATI
jgi:hypothetical protein